VIVCTQRKIHPIWPSPPAGLAGPAAQALTLLDYGDEPRAMKWPEFPCDANMALREVCPDGRPSVDVRFSHRGKQNLGGDDYALFRRLDGRYHLVWWLDAVVHHRVERHRLDRAWLRRRRLKGGVSLAQIANECGEAQPSPAGRPVRFIRIYVRALAVRRRNARTRNESPEAAWEEFLAHIWTGCHFEFLLGRFPRIAEFLAARLA
jgi:hypothetical protein